MFSVLLGFSVVFFIAYLTSTDVNELMVLVFSGICLLIIDLFRGAICVLLHMCML